MEPQISPTNDPTALRTYVERIDFWLIELTTIESTLSEKFEKGKYPESIDRILQEVSNTKQNLTEKRDKFGVDLERIQKMQHLTKSLLTDIQHLQSELNCITEPKISAADKRSALITLQVKMW